MRRNNRLHTGMPHSGRPLSMGPLASCYLERSIMDWWLTQVGRVPIGPVSTELLLKGIRAEEVPKDVLICEVDGAEWRTVTDVAPFGAAFADRKRARRFDPESERTVLDPQSFSPFEPPHRVEELRLIEDADDEKTIVDAFPPLPSEPPKGT